ncbi:MAG: LexA family transcriptional regulator [Rhodospirillaceae bacterium]
MLTRKQLELLIFINESLGNGGVSPSFDEMKEALGLRSKSGIHRLVTGLEERGFIRRLPHRARALEVIRMPGGISTLKVGNASETGEPTSQPTYHPNIIQGNFTGGNFTGAAPEDKVASDVESVSLPFYGRIAAGLPIEAMPDCSTHIGVPASLLSLGEHYALEVAGDSMIEAGILDGDIVIIRRCDVAENGTIMVALIDCTEVTLKRLRSRGKTIALEPANSAYETRIFGADRVRVQGVLVGLIRQYKH